MKKIIVPFFFLTIFLMLPLVVGATSGACSWHGGVNCSAGATLYGKVLCNDGWINSSVYFLDADECKSQSFCRYYAPYGCSIESDYSRIQQEGEQRLGSLRALQAGAGMLGQYSGAGQKSELQQDIQNKLDSCREQININNTLLSIYNQCLKKEDDRLREQADEQLKLIDNEFNLKVATLCKNLYGEGWVYDKNIRDCKESPESILERERIDAIFAKNFNLTLEAMPEYKGVADYNVVKTLTLDPANANKTFSQIIKERYPEVVKPTPISEPLVVVEEAKPVQSTSSLPVQKSYTLEELQKMGAVPVEIPVIEAPILKEQKIITNPKSTSTSNGYIPSGKTLSIKQPIQSATETPKTEVKPVEQPKPASKNIFIKISHFFKSIFSKAKGIF